MLLKHFELIYLKASKNATYHTWRYPNLTFLYRINQIILVINHFEFKGNTFHELIAQFRQGGLVDKRAQLELLCKAKSPFYSRWRIDFISGSFALKVLRLYNIGLVGCVEA